MYTYIFTYIYIYIYIIDLHISIFFGVTGNVGTDTLTEQIHHSQTFYPDVLGMSSVSIETGGLASSQQNQLINGEPPSEVD